MSAILIFLGLAFFAYYTWRSIPQGLALIALLLPSYLIRFSFVGIPFTFLEGMILIAFCVWLIRDGRWRRINTRFWRHNDSINALPLVYRVPLSLLLIAGFISALLSPAQPQAFGILKAYIIEPVLFLIVMAYEIRTKEQLDRIMAALGVTTIILGIIAYAQYITGFGIDNPFWADPETRRATTLYGYPNAVSLATAPVVAYFLGSFIKTMPLRSKLFSLTVITAGLITILTAKTTGALAALLATTLALVFVRVPRMRKLLIILVIISSIGILSLASTREHLLTLTRNVRANHLNLASSSLEIRINQWRETTQLLMDHPLKGAGLANFQNALTPYHTYDFLEIYLYPHMMLLNVWVELGLLGLIAFILLLIAVYRTIRTALMAHLISGTSHALAWGLAAAWLTIVIHGLVDVPFFKNDLSVLWMLLVGATLFLDTQTRKLATRHTKSW